MVEIDVPTRSSSHRSALMAMAVTLAVGVWFLGSFGQPNQQGAAEPPTDVSPAEPVSSSPNAETAGVIQTPDQLIRGNLPNGTEYLLSFEPGQPFTVQGISAAILIDAVGMRPVLLGIVSFDDHRRTDGLDSDGVYWRQHGGWSMRITPDIAVSTLHGDDLEKWLNDHIVGLTDRSMPAFHLLQPLRWATDGELPQNMQILYPTFVVRRGCHVEAVSCNGLKSIQILSKDDVVSPADPLRARAAFEENPGGGRAMANNRN